MFRYKFTEADIKQAKIYLKTKKGRLQVKPWVLKFEVDLSVDKNNLKYKGKDVIPQEKVDTYLRKRIYAKDADITCSRDSAHFQIAKEVVGVSRRNIMDFLRAQKSIGENREALREPKVKKGPKLNGFVFESDLVFIKRDDLIAQNPRFEKMGFDLVYCVTTVEKTTGLVRLDYTTSKRQAVITPIVKKQITEMTKMLGTVPSQVFLWTDRGTEYSKVELDKFVKQHRFVRLGPSCENKNKIFQRSFYRILKQRQALTIPNAIKKSENQMNKALSTIHKMSFNEVAEKVKAKELDSLKKYNSTRKGHVSNTKTKELQVGDFVRLLIKKGKGEFYKTYKNKTYTAEIFEIEKKTKTQPYKYKVKGKSRYYLVDYLLKSATRDTKSGDLIKGRDLIQVGVDKANEAKERVRLAKEIEDNRKRLMKLKKEGGIILPSVERGIKNLNKIQDLQTKSDKILVFLDLLQTEYEREKAKQGVQLKPKRVLKMPVGRKVKDTDYDPIHDLQDQLLEEEQPKSPKAKPKKRGRPKKVKPKPEVREEEQQPKSPKAKPKKRGRPKKVKLKQRIPKKSPFFDKFEPGGEQKVKPKKLRVLHGGKTVVSKVIQRKPETDVKQKLFREFKTLGKRVLKLQKRLRNTKGENLDLIIREMQTEIKKGQELTKLIKSKKYKNVKLNLNFFFQ
jgi:hypothetical protein